ncbi:MAG: bifunctional phosphoribosylaminoimidazolecarboxamide formyltransferase/IMP cyclohydrolase, partial [Proteobacteria bacterium]|nr:bifunctional phosphoribosylaminoimidazolecarboxamide formyltransferase/IMP cyclohydrolase [Pseudomonadota bacterium]
PMTNHPQRYAVISVSDKTDIRPLARALVACQITILASDGTYDYLTSSDHDGEPILPPQIQTIASFTGSSEILKGRVKTLHPKIYAGILAQRSDDEAIQTLINMDGGFIDYVIVNFYPFADYVKEYRKSQASNKDHHETALQNHIDIGGPCMLRAAAKNWSDVVACCDIHDYPLLISALKEHQQNGSHPGPLTTQQRKYLAAKAFRVTSDLDHKINQVLSETLDTADTSPSSLSSFTMSTETMMAHTLRYGENSHQKAKFLFHGAEPEYLSDLQILQGKPLSYNNYLDLNSVAKLLSEFSSQKLCVIIKHGAPCGFALSYDYDNSDGLVAKAMSCDTLSSFGGVVGCSFTITGSEATELSNIFLEVVMAPNFSQEAINIFAQKPNLRLIVAPWLNSPMKIEVLRQKTRFHVRSVLGGVLVQTADPPIDYELNTHLIAKAEVMGSKQPTLEEKQDALMAMKIAKHLRSNSIVLVKNGALLAQGSGFTSRIEACEAAVNKAYKMFPDDLVGASLASDGFFPFRDVIDYVAPFGVSCVVAPRGSVRDQDSCDAAREHDIALIFTARRHFFH